MNRILGIVSAMLLGLLVLVPAVAAAEPWDDIQHLIYSNGGDVSVQAGEHVDLLIVTNGRATIAGDADGVIVVNGTAQFEGGQAATVIAVDSTVSLDATASVSGDIRSIESTVDQAPGAVIGGAVVDGASDIDWTGLAVAASAIAFLAFIGFIIVGLTAGLVAAGVAARQVRSAGSLIVREPGMAFLAGLAGLFGIILASVLAMITVIGIPLGLTALIIVLPAILFAGWLVAAIWLGELILARLTPDVTRERPYLASVIGVLVLDVLSIVPFVGAIVAFFGFGAVMLYLWRTFRGRSTTSSTQATTAASAAV